MLLCSLYNLHHTTHNHIYIDKYVDKLFKAMTEEMPLFTTGKSLNIWRHFVTKLTKVSVKYKCVNKIYIYII